MEYYFLILLRDFSLLVVRPRGILKAQRSEWKLISFDFFHICYIKNYSAHSLFI